MHGVQSFLLKGKIKFNRIIVLPSKIYEIASDCLFGINNTA